MHQKEVELNTKLFSAIDEVVAWLDYDVWSDCVELAAAVQRLKSAYLLAKLEQQKQMRLTCTKKR